MSKASEAGKSFLAGVLAKLPESLRGQAETVFAAADAESALEVMGTGALAQPEINRKLDEIRQQNEGLRQQEVELTAKFDELNAWYDVNQKALEDYKVLKAGVTPPKDPPKDPSPMDIRTQVEAIINEQARDYVALSAFMMTQGGRHYAMFQEPLDGMELLANPKLGKPIAGQPGKVFSLENAYQEKYGDRLAARQKEAEDARIKKLVDEGMAEERRKAPSHPFPIRQEAAAIDLIPSGGKSSDHTVDSAVALYEQLSQARSI